MPNKDYFCASLPAELDQGFKKPDSLIPKAITDENTCIIVYKTVAIQRGSGSRLPADQISKPFIPKFRVFVTVEIVETVDKDDADKCQSAGILSIVYELARE